LTLSHEGIGMTSRRTRERMIGRIREQGVSMEAVLEVMLQTPRHLFVEEALAGRAYEDMPLPIGFNQTISQPYSVARMTELLLENRNVEKVLEVGTGSGYQTAVLAQLVGKVYSVERIYPLQQRARRCLQNQRLRNIRLQHTDGNEGWPEYAPYDGILVTAAPSRAPQALLDQLAPGGRLIIPIGDGRDQMLHRFTRTETGFGDEEIEPVIFVPLLDSVI
jgi:protein-L-isoaspartate(D-aspartate) O-methyltransferase